MSVAIAGLKAATSEERAEFLSLLGPAASVLGMQGPAAAKPAKATKAKVVKTPMPLPEGMPSAADYRMTASSIDDSVCVGRAIGEEDKRWRPFVFRETQCGEKLAEGSDLCKKCTARAAKYAAEPKPGPWTGRVTEDPLDWVHMLGTVWAEEKKPKYSAAVQKAPAAAPASAPASASAATASLAEEEFAFAPASATVVVSTPEPAFSSSSSVVDKAAAKVAAAAAAAAAKASAKEAEKAAKAAAKEAEKAAIKAVKDKAKLDAAAAVAAAKAAKAPKAPKPSAAKSATAAVKVTAPAAAAAASDSAAAASDSAAAGPISVEGELKLIDGTLYMVKNGNVYEYDELTEKAGDFVGRITAEETIDTEGAEVGAAESDTD